MFIFSNKKNVKNICLGSLWLLIGFLILSYVFFISFPFKSEQSLPQSIEVISEMSAPISAPAEITQPDNEKQDNLLIEDSASPKVMMEPQVTVEENEMSLKIDKDYMNAFELFKTKIMMSDIKENSELQFKNYLTELGIIITEDGMLVDANGMIVPVDIIECRVMGYYPGKPYIKTNCG